MLENVMVEFGPLTSVLLPTWQSGRSKRVGIVRFEDAEDARTAAMSPTGVKLLDRGQPRFCPVAEYVLGVEPSVLQCAIQYPVCLTGVSSRDLNESGVTSKMVSAAVRDSWGLLIEEEDIESKPSKGQYVLWFDLEHTDLSAMKQAVTKPLTLGGRSIQVYDGTLSDTGVGITASFRRPVVNHQLLLRLPDKVFAPRLLKFLETILQARSTTLEDISNNYSIKISGGGNGRVPGILGKLLWHADQLSREMEATPIAFTLMEVTDAEMYRVASRLGMPRILKQKQLWGLSSRCGVFATRVAWRDLHPHRTPESDEQFRSGGGRPRYLAAAPTSASDGVLLWGTDACVRAAERSLRAEAAGTDEVSLELGAFIVRKLVQGDLNRAIRGRKHRYGKAKMNQRTGTVRVWGEVGTQDFGKMLMSVVAYLATTAPSNVGYVGIGDAGTMRQLLATDELSRLASEQEFEVEIRTIPLWQCHGVLVVAPDERVGSTSNEEDEDESDGDGALECMCEAIREKVWHWKRTHFKLPLSASGVKSAEKDLAKGSQPSYIVDFRNNVEGLEHLWLDGMMIRGRAADGQRAAVLGRLQARIKQKCPGLFNPQDLA
eukprot:g2096.t1